MPNFTVTLTIADDSSFDFQVVVPGVYHGALITTGIPVCTIANGGITAFNIDVLTDPEVTDPTPNVLFDFIGSGANVSYDTASGALTISGVAFADIIGDSNPDAPVPFQIFLTLGSTLVGVDAPARVAPVEGNFATGTWSFQVLGDQVTIDCSITIPGPSEPLSIGCGNRPVGLLGLPYSSVLAPSGGSPPYTFAITAGSLPPGLSLDPVTGIISGTPTSAGTYAFTAEVDDLVETASDVEIFPDQLPELFDVSANAANRPIVNVGGDLYLFLVDGVVSFTWQIFVYKSIDGGVTWTDVTPGSPVKSEEAVSTTLGLQYVEIAGVVYIPQVFRQSDSTQWIRVYRFDTGSLAWLADSADLQIGAAGDSFIPLQIAARASGEIVLISSNFASGGDQSVLVVYDSGTNTFTSGPSNIAGLSVADVSASGVDSLGHLHFFCGTWPDDTRDVAGTFEAQHYVVNLDNSITGPDSIATITPFFVASHDSGNAAWVAIGQPVFYAEQNGTKMMAVPIRVDSTTIGIFTAVESDTPAWTQAATITSGAGQVFETSSACFMPVSALFPVNFAGQTRLYCFWVSQTGDLWNNFGDSFVFHAYLSNGTLSAVTVDYSGVAQNQPGVGQFMPGSVYPVGISQSGTTLKFGVFFPSFPLTYFNGSAPLGNFLQAVFENLLTITLTQESASVNCSISVALAIQGTVAGGRPTGRGWNDHDACLQGIRECYRRICKQICPKPRPMTSWPWDQEEGIPPDAVPFRVADGILTPFPVDGDVAVLSFRVPVGYDGLIMQGFNLYTGTGFVQGSGDILWRIQINNRYFVKDWGSIAFQLGAVQDPFPFTDCLFVTSNQYVTMLVNVPNLSGAIETGASRILGALMGYWIPR